MSLTNCKTAHRYPPGLLIRGTTCRMRLRAAYSSGALKPIGRICSPNWPMSRISITVTRSSGCSGARYSGEPGVGDRFP